MTGPHWRGMARLGSALGFTLLVLSALAHAGDPPRLIFEAPPRLAAIVERLERVSPQAVRSTMDLVGLDSAPPVSITLATDDSDAARRTPPWVTGYAVRPSRRIVLFPERQLSYPHGSLEELLLHELTHVFAMEASGGRANPRWFEEGLAMVGSQERTLRDELWGAWTGLTITPKRLAEIEGLFEQDRRSAQQAYLLAERLVRYLIERWGPDAPRRILRGRAQGVPFEQALETVTDGTVPQFERDFWAEQRAWQRWIPVATSSAILWAAIVLLAWLAWRKQRRHAATVQRRWEEEDRLP